MSHDLVKYEAARQALQAAHSVDEVKDIRDKAEAMRAYARQANDNDMAIWAGKIKFKAEHRIGQMLEETERAEGGRPEKTRTKKEQVIDDTPTLDELGITRKESSQWQQIAGIIHEEALDA